MEDQYEAGEQKCRPCQIIAIAEKALQKLGKCIDKNGLNAKITDKYT